MRTYSYPALFVSKLTDSDTENKEIRIWLKFAFDCKYIDEVKFVDLKSRGAEVGKIPG